MVSGELEKMNVSSLKGKLRGFFLGNNRFALYLRKEIGFYFGYAAKMDEKPVFNFESVTTKTGEKGLLLTLAGYENPSADKEEEDEKDETNPQNKK